MSTRTEKMMSGEKGEQTLSHVHMHANEYAHTQATHKHTQLYMYKYKHMQMADNFEKKIKNQ